MLTPTSQAQRSAVLVLAASDPAEAGTLALAMHGVAAVTADPRRGQLMVRYDPTEVEAQRIVRTVRPELEFDATGVCMLLNAWPTLARAFPVAASLL